MGTTQENPRSPTAGSGTDSVRLDGVRLDGVRSEGARSDEARTEGARSEGRRSKGAPEEAGGAQQAERKDDGAEAPGHVSRNLMWSLTASASSMVVHLAGLLILGLIALSTGPKPPPPTIHGTVDVERPLHDLFKKLPPPEKPALEKPADNTSRPQGAPGAAPAGVRRATEHLTQKPTADVKVNADHSRLRVDVGPVNVFRSTGSDFRLEVPYGMAGDPLATAATYNEAMDRITQEILNKLAKGKVLVVWVMDQSESMNDDRDEIMGRIERVYVELGLATDEASGKRSDALLTAVTSFGAGVALHTPQPTSKPSEITAALAAVPNDPSGAEMMCQAVNFSLLQHQKFVLQGNRQMMIVLVTDESGDPASNAAQLEATVQNCRNLRTPVYVLGREAVFGYPYAHMHWIDPATKIPFWLRIDRGPETPFAEQLQIDGIHRRFDAHPSGFGPYEQARLARQTGGVFFLLPSPEANLWRRDERTYEADSMRSYLPDLSSRQDYATERDKHPLRAVLWKVICDLNPYDARGQVKADTPVQVRFWDWPTDRAKFAVEANHNLKKARTLLDYLGKAQAALESVANHRDREPSLRWRANYDITYAQTIAYQARLHEYIAYIGAFIHNPKAIKNEFGQARPTNSWDGHYVKRTLVNDSKVAAMREKSTELYKKVIADHPGTPWAARAEYELKRGFGCDLHEDYEDPRRPTVKTPVL